MDQPVLEEPRLVGIAGDRLAGQIYPLRSGAQVIGRGGTADITADCPDVSREHAYISWDGSVAAVVDAGSRNGTAVNGQRLAGRRSLRPGDVLRLGSAEFRFEASVAAGHAEAPTTALGRQGGLSNEIGRDNYGDVVQAGHDVKYEHFTQNRLDLDQPFDELIQGRGIGRFLLALGLLVALAGFAGWTYLILSAGESIESGIPAESPFELKLLGLPAPMVAFGSFLVGGVVASIGLAMSKAARRRVEDARWRRANDPRFRH
jgi:pSer/pThr/pTyr-binding forkhead associated (FHA) protein